MFTKRTIIHIAILFMVFVMVAIVAPPVFSGVYKYTDENGNVSFTDDLSNVPAEKRKDLKEIKSVKSRTDSVKNQRKSNRQNNINLKDEVLYYDNAANVKIVNRDGFLLKITRNEQGLKIFTEVGPYPEAYPPHLPDPGTHIDSPPVE